MDTSAAHLLTNTQVLLAVASGGAVGFSLGLIGGGGSILAVPLLLYLVRYPDPHVVIGTTALAVSTSAYINLVPHARAGNVRWREGVTFALIGAAAAFAGSSLGKIVDGKKLLFLFALLMLVVAALMARPRPAIPRAAVEGKPPHGEFAKIAGAAAAVGLLSGFFGIGGGFLIVPGLVFSTGMSMLSAVGTSLLSVGTFGLTTALNYARSGLIDWKVAGLYIGGGVLGGWFGARWATHLGARRKDALQKIFAALVIVVAIYMLYRNFSAFSHGHARA